MQKVPLGKKEAQGPSVFPTTHWSVVAGARERVPEALARLCETYREPIRAFLRATGQSDHDAEDLCQGFLTHLLQPGKLDRVEPQKGRFRAFLLAALKNYVRDQVDKAKAAKRGGGAKHVPWDAEGSNVARKVADGGLTPDEVFDLCWAQQVVRNAMRRLRHDARSAGRAELVSVLAPHLYGDETRIDYQTLAMQTGMSPNASRCVKSRLVARLRGLIVEELKSTLPNDADVKEELLYLASVLNRAGGLGITTTL